VSKKSLAKPEVRAFVEFYLTNATRLVDEVGYIPLPEASYQAGLERLKAGATGTCFGGHSEAGLHIDELFKRPLTSVPHADPKPADKSK
jgi:phosphate transport system substrate-binding protein